MRFLNRKRFRFHRATFLRVAALVIPALAFSQITFAGDGDGGGSGSGSGSGSRSTAPTATTPSTSTTDAGKAAVAAGAAAKNEVPGEMCDTEATAAKAACNAGGFAGMDPEQGAMMEMMLGQAMNMIGSMGSGASTAESCKKQADLSKIMALVSAAKAAACAGAMSLCKSHCDDEAGIAKGQITGIETKMNVPGLPEPQRAEYQKQIEKLKQNIKHGDANKNLCSRYSVNVMMAGIQGMSFLGNMNQSNACAAAASLTPFPYATLPPIPTPYPITINPTSDCSDVNNSSLTCVCLRTPTASLCGSGTPGSGVGTNLAGSASGGRPFSPDSSALSDGALVDKSNAQAKPSSASNTSGDGGGGAFGGGSGSSGGFGADSGGAGGPANGIDKNVITGASNGAGGGAGSGGGYATGGGGAGTGKSATGAGGFDWGKFLPSKKDYKNRGLAGMSIPSVDGITGPMGPTIWEKVTNRFQQKKATFIPEK